MAYDNNYTAVTGGTLSAAQWNTHVRDNFTSLWPYTTGGDVSYATSATALARLAAPTNDGILYNTGAALAYLEASSSDAYKVLRQNAAGDGFEFSGGGIKVYSLFDGTDYTNSTRGSWRDVPNASSSDVVVDTTSTVIAYGSNSSAGAGTFSWRKFAFHIDGTNLDDTFFSEERYAIGEATATSVGGIKTGVTAGTITVKMREYLEDTATDSYTSINKWFIVLVIPE